MPAACSTGSPRSSRAPGPSRSPPTERLEELLLTRIANENPAIGPLHELVDDRPLAERHALRARRSPTSRRSSPPVRRSGGDGGSLIELMRAAGPPGPDVARRPAALRPARWGSILGSSARRPHPAVRPRARRSSPRRSARSICGSVAATGGGGRRTDRRRRRSPAPPTSPRRSRPTRPGCRGSCSWPRARTSGSTSCRGRYGREIRTLDAIPDEELDDARALGRHRPVAHRPVGALEGVGDGSSGCAATRTRSPRPTRSTTTRSPTTSAARPPMRACATGRGRAASGSRATWCPTTWASIRAGSSSIPSGSCRCPSRPTRPTRFTGPDLSPDDRVAIVLEDHYWDDSDAAVVFKRFDRRTGDERYVYHGNDGTSFPWNDTAQLDFLDAEVREHVIRTILDVARRFPIIRFDAAMVLAKKHIQRLWWPEPGPGRRHPVARRARDAEGRVRRGGCRSSSGARSSTGSPPRSPTRSCWPRRSGCSRATSSGRSACTASTTARSCTCSATRTRKGYRKVIRETIEFDPEILKRYVNFMSNPDEKTALEQFGKGDKYFGVATVLATLPGLPMLGHGQIQGFGEKYGMEFRRAMLDEQPDPWLVERHEREIFPLLHRRAWFAEAADFLLYDLVTDGGVDEDGPRLLERVRAAALARPVPRAVRLDDRTHPSLGRATRSRRRTARSGRSGGRWPTASGCRTTRRCSSRSATPGPGSSTVRSCARSASAGSSSRSTPTAATSSGSSARSATASRASGAGSRRGSAAPASRRSTTRCASSSSSRSTRRSGRSSPTA